MTGADLKWLLRLYPRQWRERYGEEFVGLLEDVKPGFGGVADVVWEACKMRIASIDGRKLAGFALAGLVISAVVAYRTPEKFASSAVVRLTAPADAEPEVVRAEAMRLQREVLSRTSLSNLIQQPQLELYRSERKRKPLEDVIEQMKKEDLGIRMMTPKPGSKETVLALTYFGPDPARARLLVEKLVRRLVDDHQNTQRMTAVGLAEHTITDAEAKMAGLGSRLDVLDAPSLDKNPVYPNRMMMLFTGVVAGISGFFLFAGLRRFWKRVAAGTVGAVVAWVLVFSYLQQPFYSRSLMQVDSPETLRTIVGNQELLAGFRDEALQRVGSPDLQPEQIRIEAGVDPRALGIVVWNNNRFVAQRGNQAMITAIVDNLVRRRAAAGRPRGGSPRLEVVDPPTLPVSPSPPGFILSLPQWLVLGGGALGAMAASILSRRTQRTLPQNEPSVVG